MSPEADSSHQLTKSGVTVFHFLANVKIKFKWLYPFFGTVKLNEFSVDTRCHRSAPEMRSAGHKTASSCIACSNSETKLQWLYACFLSPRSFSYNANAANICQYLKYSVAAVRPNIVAPLVQEQLETQFQWLY
jgi:hypothetical protein